MISFILPWIRENGKNKCIESIHQNVGLPDYLYEIVEEEDKNRIGSNTMVARLTSRTNFNLVVFVADDITIEPECIPEAIKTMNSFDSEDYYEPWGMVGFFDGKNNPDILATHWMCHKKLLDYLNGYFLYPGYKHCFSDQELHDRCNMINRYKSSYKSKIIHNHPAFDKSIVPDKDYKRIYSPPYFIHDNKLYEKRKKNGYQN